jgi:NAD(P)-dependent dehydrogenase (short-subunit alcohol dehydrogenase family)
LAVDVNIPESIAQLKKDVTRITDGKLDYLVNNAGRNYTVPALDLDFEEVEETFKTNVFSVMRMCKEFAPLLIEAKGTIVQIGSLAGVMLVKSVQTSRARANTRQAVRLRQRLQRLESRSSRLQQYSPCRTSTL